jgi:hypothetical protein
MFGKKKPASSKFKVKNSLCGLIFDANVVSPSVIPTVSTTEEILFLSGK